MKSRHVIVLAAIALLVFGTAFSVRADKVRSVEERFYNSHDGHSRFGSIDLDSGVGTDVGPYAHPDLAIDRWNWPAINGAVYQNHFYTILNRRVPLGEDPPQPEARLARVNVHTGKVKLLGSPIGVNLGGMEISYCGEVYATGFSLINALGGFYGDTNLYRVDRKEGTLTLIGDTGLERIMDLAFDPQGTLWATVGNVLYTLDLETGSPTAVATISGADTEIMGIAFTSEGELYGTTPWADVFYRIDPESGAATAVGNTGFAIAHGGDIPMIPEDTRCP